MGRDEREPVLPSRTGRRGNSCYKSTERQNGYEGEKGSTGTTVVEQYRKLEMPTANETSDAEFGKETNTWAGANVDASEREDSGSEGSQRGFTREEVKKCVAKLKS